MLVLVSAGLGSLLFAFPTLGQAMRWIGAAWMLFLAWQIANAEPPGQSARGRVLGFFGAMAFQWINPKAWLIAVGVASEFTRPDQPLAGQLARVAVVFLAVSLPCMLPWVMVGRGAATFLRSPLRFRAFNIAMALLLVVSLLPVAAGE
jgi:threonine/homoserine/homoserine lactone efflux protein